MKTVFLVALVLLVAAAQQNQACCGQSTVSTTGSSKLSAPPDIATISITATETRNTTKAAANAVNQQIAKALAVLQSNNIRPQDIKTTQISVYPQYDYNNGSQTLRGQQASQTITAKVRNIGTDGAAVARLVDGLSDIQNINVGGVSFDIDNKTSLNAQARAQAYADAKDKATQYSQLSGLRLGAALTITDTNVAYTPQQPMYAMAMSASVGGGAAQIPTGEIEINYSIEVTWKLV